MPPEVAVTVTLLVPAGVVVFGPTVVVRLLFPPPQPVSQSTAKVISMPKIRTGEY